MPTNIEKYRQELDSLIANGDLLLFAMQLECDPDSTKEQLEDLFGDGAAKFIKGLPIIYDEYQTWYSEAKALIRQLLPDRLDDFVRHYEKPKPRKAITFDNYRIEDFLQGLIITRGYAKEKVVGPDAALPELRQQLAIVKSIKRRFDSSLFDIQQLAQADLFDSEVDAAHELLKHKFNRAAGAIAGVVLEKHLGQVCINHAIKFRKKNLTISDYNDALKKASVIDVPQWRAIQQLGDIRNLCDHNKDTDPTRDQVKELLDGVSKVIKTLF